MLSPIEKEKQGFLEYLEIEKNRAIKTIQNYDFYLTRFITQTEITHPTDITLEKVKKFRLWLNRYSDERKQEPLSKRTQNYHMIALRSFLKYLSKMDVATLAPEKIELAKEPQRQVEFLENDELMRLLQVPLCDASFQKVEHPSIIALRDAAILEVLFSTGLRVSEATHLTKEMVSTDRDECTVRGKGGKLRIVFLHERARSAIKQYLEQRDDLSPYLFTSHDTARKSTNRESEKPLTPRSVQRIIQKYAKMAGITKKITPHTMRHTYATDLLQNGADIRSVQALLGHASITTTQVYTHVTDAGLKEVHKKFHGKKRS